VPKRLLALLTVAVAAVLAVRKSISDQQAERDLWAEATDDVRADPSGNGGR
jgi:hypothetical protein